MGHRMNSGHKGGTSYVDACYCNALQSDYHGPGGDRPAGEHCFEETALSHILNAEGEKIQKVLAQEPADFCRIVEVNESVVNMVSAVSNLELILKDKLEFVANNLYYPAQEES